MNYFLANIKRIAFWTFILVCFISAPGTFALGFAATACVVFAVTHFERRAKARRSTPSTRLVRLTYR